MQAKYLLVVIDNVELACSEYYTLPTHKDF